MITTNNKNTVQNSEIFRNFSARFKLYQAVLGPLLVLLCIYDLPNCLSHCEPRMYADDTHLTYADNNVGSIESCLGDHEDLLNVHTWLNASELTLNMTRLNTNAAFLPINKLQLQNFLAYQLMTNSAGI